VTNKKPNTNTDARRPVRTWGKNISHLRFGTLEFDIGSGGDYMHGGRAELSKGLTIP
jgi:hypothetical protein